MAEQIKFGDRLYLKGEELVLDNGSGSGVIKATSGTVEIKGNLVVTGDTTTVNSIQTSFADPKLLINGDLTGAPSEDVGIEIERGTSDNKFLLWNETTDKWSVGAETFVAGIFEGNLTGNVTGDITSSGSTFSNIDINGGAIDGTIIGANTPAAGTFSTVNATTITGALVGNVTGTVSSIANHTTSDLTEGTNLYYTDARVDARYATLQADSNFIETLDGQNGAYYLDYNNLTNVPTVIGSIDDLSDVDTTTNAPTTGQTIIWNGTNFVPGNNFSQSDFDSAFTAKDTDDLSEGTTNLYHTTARARASISATGSLSYDSGTGVVSYTQGNTDTVAEGSTNLYYTDARADARAQLKIDALVDSSPGTLDTLNELAAALGDDANFATTMTTSLAGKEPTITAGTTSQYYRGDKSFQTLDTLAVAENTNLYYTDTRARAAISATGSLSYNSSTGVISFTQGNTYTVAEGSSNLYYTDARADARAQLKIDALVDSAPGTLDTLNELAAALGDDANFSTTITNSIATKLAIADFNSTFDTRLGTKTTSDLTEGTNLYYTDARARASISATDSLSYNSTSGVISFTQGNTDTVADGSSNLYFTDARADARIAAADTDDLSEGSSNLYHTTARARSSISVSGDLSYNSSTGVISFSATASPVSSVNSQTGAIVLDTDDVAEGSSNLYYTDARARSSISVSGDISYNSSTGVISTTGLASSDTDDLAEGTTNLYYTDARAQAVSINNIVEDTSPQLGGTLDLNTFDLTTLDDTVTLTTNATPSIVTGTVGASTETLLSNTTVTVNDDGDYANSVSSYITLTSTQIDTLGFKGDSSLTYFGSAASSSNFVFRDTGDSIEQNSMVVVYSPPTDTYTFTLASQHADTDSGTPGVQNQLNITADDTDIKFKQYAYGEMTVSSSTALSNSNIQLRDEDGFYIDKAHVDVTNTSGNNYKIVFWTHSVSVGDTIEVVNPSSSTAIFTWGAEDYNETGLVASSESFSISSSSNDLIAIGDLDFTAGNITGEVVGTLVYDKPSTKSIVSGLTTVSIDGTDYQSALTVSDVPIIISGNSGTSNEVSLAIGTGSDGRIHQLDNAGVTTFKFPVADGSANQVMKTDGSGDISWATQSTDYVTEGSNLYYTDARADARAQLKIDALIGGASSAFDTLLEIENAMATDTELSSAISGLNHDTLSGFVANEHIDWTQASAGTIDPSNYSNTGDTTYTAGTGLSLSGTTFTNTSPDQTVTLTGAGATSISGTYPNFTITSTDSSTNISGTIEPATDNTYNLGSPTKKYANIYGHSVHATYADLAERYATDVPYEPGTVVVFGGEAEITTTSIAGDVSVAGVISTNPAIKLNADAGNSVTHPYVALRGRVPCNMIGPVSKGDLIITAHDEPGYAKSNGKFDAGRSVFAKSLETNLTEGKKVIEVVIL